MLAYESSGVGLSLRQFTVIISIFMMLCKVSLFSVTTKVVLSFLLWRMALEYKLSKINLYQTDNKRQDMEQGISSAKFFQKNQLKQRQSSRPIIKRESSNNENVGIRFTSKGGKPELQ